MGGGVKALTPLPNWTVVFILNESALEVKSVAARFTLK